MISHDIEALRVAIAALVLASGGSIQDIRPVADKLAGVPIPKDPVIAAEQVRDALTQLRAHP